MGATQPPSEFVRPGNPVMVVKEREHKAAGFIVREVDRVNLQHFTVAGVDTPGAKPIPVRLRNRARTELGGPVHHAASGSLNWYVIEATGEQADRVRREVAERKAVNRVTRAAEEWRKIEDRRSSVAMYDRRPTPAEVDAALVELAAAAVELRGVLGVPEGVEA